MLKIQIGYANVKNCYLGNILLVAASHQIKGL